jgi:hypothetical protein
VINRGIDLNIADETGFTALMMAAKQVSHRQPAVSFLFFLCSKFARIANLFDVRCGEHRATWRWWSSWWAQTPIPC